MNRKLLFAVVSVVLVGVASAQVRVFQADQPAQAADINTNFLVVAPPGMVTIWAGTGTNPPNGWLFCDGTSFSGTTYPNLQAALGGTTLPDLRGRVVVGLDTASLRITDATANVIGEVGGSDRTTDVVAHTHAIAADPGHQHPMRASCNGTCGNGTDGFARGAGNIDTNFATNAAGGHNHGGATASTGQASLTNLPPYATYRYIIKY